MPRPPLPLPLPLPWYLASVPTPGAALGHSPACTGAPLRAVRAACSILFDTGGDDRYASLDGIRAICMLWVVRLFQTTGGHGASVGCLPSALCPATTALPRPPCQWHS